MPALEGSGAESGLVAIKSRPPQQRSFGARIAAKQEAILVEALDRSLTAQGYRVLAPGPKPKSYQTLPMRGLWWGIGRRGLRPTLV